MMMLSRSMKSGAGALASALVAGLAGAGQGIEPRSDESMKLEKAPVVRVEMLIRKPVGEVFEALVDPAITTKFWFTRSSGRLEAGKRIQWDWEMYGASMEIAVKALEPRKGILIEWSAYGAPTTVEFAFTPRADNTTLVGITERGFVGSGDEVVQHALGSTEGFTFVLSGLKALLEHGLVLNLVRDRFPDGLPKE